MTSELETNIVAVERIKEYSETETEVSYHGSSMFSNKMKILMHACTWSFLRLLRWFLLWELSFNLNKCRALNCNLFYHSSKLLLLSCSLCLASHLLLLWVAIAQEMSFTSEYWSLCVWSVWCTVSPVWLVPWSCSWAELQYNYQVLHMFSIVLLFNQFYQSSPPMRKHL